MKNTDKVISRANFRREQQAHLEKPTRYLDSVRDPNYQKDLVAYLGRMSEARNRMLAALPCALGIPPGEPQDYLDSIENSWTKNAGAKQHFPEDGDKHIIRAWRLFREPYPFLHGVLGILDDANRLGGAICCAIGRLLRDVEVGDSRERQEASKRLKRIFAAIIPETRGKKRNTADPDAVMIVYYKELFRFHHIAHALKNLPGTPRNRIATVSERFDVEVKQLKRLFCLDEDYTLDGGAKPLVRGTKDIDVRGIAEIRTAEHFKFKSTGRVSNIRSAQSKSDKSLEWLFGLHR